MAITSLVLGILVLLATMSIMTDGGDVEEIVGASLFGVISVILAVISLVQKRWGKGLSIAGVAMSAISFLAIAGV
ncbi:hypothetical protein [Eoetvoesiella caeni]